MIGLQQVLKDILTGIGGQSYALMKVVGLALMLVFIGLSIAAFWTGKHFDGQAYGIGAGVAIAAMGAAIKLAQDQEPIP